MPRRKLSIWISLVLILVFPLMSVTVQGTTSDLSPRIGEIQARTLTEAVIWLYAALVLAIALFGEGRTLASIGIRRPTIGTLLWGLGSAVAILAIAAPFSLLVRSVFSVPNNALAQTEALVRGSVVYAVCLAVRGGVVEELLFRGLAIEQLAALTGRRRLSALVATLFFIFVHGLRFDGPQLILISVPAFAFTGLYLWRRNLLINMIAHFLIDALSLVVVAAKITSLY